ncbi:MAG: hypothetical protein AB7H90_10180 [Alphaproteobacteria bacterium]
MSEASFRGGLLVFPNLTQRDLTGPHEILARLPGSERRLVWKTRDPVRSEHGLTILPDATFDDCGRLDLVLARAAALLRVRPRIAAVPAALRARRPRPP